MDEKYKVLMIDDEADIVGFFAKTFENFKHIEFWKNCEIGSVKLGSGWSSPDLMDTSKKGR